MEVIKKFFLSFIIFSFALAAPIYVKTAAPSFPPRSILPEEFHYFGRCKHCGDPINRFDIQAQCESFGHRCTQAPAQPAPQQQAASNPALGDQPFESEEIASSDDDSDGDDSNDDDYHPSGHAPRRVAQNVQQQQQSAQPHTNPAPVTLHITGFNKSDGSFIGHVLCPIEKCSFRCAINHPQHSYLRLGTLLIAAHLKQVHGIESPAFIGHS